MGSRILKPFNKVMGAIGLVDDDDDEIFEKEHDEEHYVEEDYEPNVIENKKNKVVSIKSNSIPKVVLKKPRSLEDMMGVVYALKARKIVVINIVDADPKESQRLIDYIVGACHALDGYFEVISRYIYLIAPENVEITNELKHEISNNNNSFFSFDQ